MTVDCVVCNSQTVLVAANLEACTSCEAVQVRSTS